MDHIASSKYAPKECPRCGRLLVCTGNIDCWCFEITIPETTRDYIAGFYEGCLCPECINELLKGKDFRGNRLG